MNLSVSKSAIVILTLLITGSQKIYPQSGSLSTNTRNIPQMYYNRKVAEGKNPMLVMNALRCKVLSRVFATVKRGTPYVDVKKFAA